MCGIVSPRRAPRRAAGRRSNMSGMLHLASLLLVCAPRPAAVQDAPAETIVPRDWLTLEALDRRGRRPFRADAVFARYLLDPGAVAPVEGETLEGGELERAATWSAATADDDGRVGGREVAWAYATFISGAGFPDLALVDSSVLAKGDGGVLAAGWFDAAWRWNGGLVERGSEGTGGDGRDGAGRER